VTHESPVESRPQPPCPEITTLYRGGIVHGPAGPAGPDSTTGTTGRTEPLASALVVTGGRIAWIGSDEAASGYADGVDAVVELDGALARSISLETTTEEVARRLNGASAAVKAVLTALDR